MMLLLFFCIYGVVAVLEFTVYGRPGVINHCFTRKTIDFTRKTFSEIICLTRKTLDFTRKTFHITRKTVGFTVTVVIYYFVYF